jgi:hypothetical protein
MAVRENYSHKKADEAKRTRRKEAEARQEIRNSRTNVQQLAKLDAGGFAAKKERARLCSQ